MKQEGIEHYDVPQLETMKIHINPDWSDELKTLATKKNIELEKLYSTYSQSVENTQTVQKFNIRYVEWAGLLCYSQKNWFDFNLMSGKARVLFRLKTEEVNLVFLKLCV